MITRLVAVIMIAFFIMSSVAFADDTYVTLWQRKMRPVVGEGNFGVNFASSVQTPTFTNTQYSFSAAANRQPLAFLKADYHTDITINRPDLQFAEFNPGYVNIQMRRPELNIRSAPMAVYFATNFHPNFGTLQLPSINMPLKELPTAELDNCPCIKIKDLNADFPCDNECSECAG